MNPPSKFQPCGEIIWALVQDEPPAFAKRQLTRGRKAQGIKYEKAVHEHFRAQYGEDYRSGVWISFREKGIQQPRLAQIDALLVQKDLQRVTIVEVKYKHTELAWWQLHRLYKPLVRHLFSKELDIHCCEVVKWFDPHELFPEVPKLCRVLEEAPLEGTGVHIWKP